MALWTKDPSRQYKVLLEVLKLNYDSTKNISKLGSQLDDILAVLTSNINFNSILTEEECVSITSRAVSLASKEGKISADNIIKKVTVEEKALLSKPEQ